jgi:predicted DNA-binding transcriptional regulator
MHTEEKIKISKIDKTINVMIVDETPQDWRFWKAFNRVLNRQNDLALRVYAALLERKGQFASRDLASLVDVPLYSVRRVLGDLYELGLVERDRVERGHMTFDKWRVKTEILGIMRLIPRKYFRGDYPAE